MKKITIPTIEYGTNGPIIILCTAAHPHHDLNSLAARIHELTEEAFVLCSFEVEDWNRDYSPWTAPAAFGEEDFEGCGAETLKRMQDDYLPELRKHFQENRKIYILGYSLAGLFALWNVYELGVFDGVASCSGSLWFPGWDQYVHNAKLTHACDIYLSLGTKEEKTRNPVMAAVGDRTRALAERLKQENAVRHSILEMNPGGHFNDPELRMAKGAAWLINQAEEK